MSEVRSNFSTLRVEHDDQTFEYICTYYDATKSLEVFTRLSKHVGEPLGKLFGGDAEEGEGLDAKLEKVLPSVLESFANRIDRVETVTLVKDILDCLQFKNPDTGITMKVNFNDHFKGRIGLMFKLVLEVLKFQYGDLGKLFSGSGGLTSILKSLQQ